VMLVGLIFALFSAVDAYNLSRAEE
jgi:hypothetical protein